MERLLKNGMRTARRIVIGVIGFTVLLLGLCLLVLPGPAFVVIPIGLGLLAIEFEWARRWLRAVRRIYRSSAAETSDVAANAPRKDGPEV